MSRSHRKHSITGHTTSESDKWYKRFFHRKERARVRNLLSHCQYEELEFELPYDDWSAPKDGKKYFDREEFPELMRK